MEKLAQPGFQTLCYWVASKPKRQLNFIRLWEITEEEGDTDQSLELLKNLLEMIFALAFQSLPQPTLEHFLGTQEFSLRGLNVVSPLLRNISISPNERAECRQWLALSPSLETKEFMKARTDELQKSQNLSLHPSSPRRNYVDIQREFSERIAPHFCPCKDQGGIAENPRYPVDNEKIALYLAQRDVQENIRAFPFGLTKGRIGFVLDFDIPPLKWDGEVKASPGTGSAPMISKPAKERANTLLAIGVECSRMGRERYLVGAKFYRRHYANSAR
ncbi:hypothetical protein N7517_011212 [Penicillium concentricum]|uniref:Uncharacterized protein n=1 Tax=Penicillium concentricum TaxID=293559 RepID=A0A9W9UT62_9EURO|nr:uncharacterized protein N7517_011212 [Penicillium concentricum]KAJ5356603.1 hypothetical protein N7517_011212 [Penicillium concentricum]